ncbi:Mss4-like family protein [Cavenderia fasciculata]|uniref:Mss4-like family protein n=1 Tax=Cavenderia fasciculata TaxID=261658 RepID=F4QEW4_CACFS|nr:Mss4-like family protein [Cavenderia fasciculata]EGG14171.1 Mss4-like family protein [Cavenderia fasciculata]|eukprot:XP_004350879.1 Mss4-like family protein [Cavenderia fasciculata]
MENEQQQQDNNTNEQQEQQQDNTNTVVVEEEQQGEPEGIPIEEINRDPNVDNAFADASNFTIIVKNEEAPAEGIAHPETKKLTKRIHCRRCDCTVLIQNNATLIPLLNQKGSDTAEELKWMWFLPDMFQFENIAFSKDVKNKIKYLTCAECEYEIIGVHDLTTKENYIAHDRIVYK